MIIVMSVVLFVIYKDNKVSLAHAKVINRINNELGLWKVGKMQASLYDNKWKKFGYEKSIKGILHYIIVIVTITAALIASLFLVES